MDKKIQDAAGNYQPPFQDKDWDQMAVLLDQHLPQEKKKRSRFFWVLSGLFVGLPLLCMLTTYKPKPTMVGRHLSNSTVVRNTPTTPPAPTASTALVPPAEKEHSGAQPPTKDKEPFLQTNNDPFLPGTGSTSRKGRRSSTATSLRIPKTESLAPAPENTFPEKPTRNNEWENTGVEKEQSLTSKEHPPITSLPVPSGTISTPDADTSLQKTGDSIAVAERPKPSEQKQEKPRPASAGNRGGKWEISLSAGPDLSLVGFDKTGQWKMQYGFGISYALNSKWKIRSGFLASRKLYQADSSDYHPPANFWTYYTKLEKIEANCLVYEIPLNVQYSFPETKKHQWFVSAGLSSYLMKNENYEYYYKNATGQPQYRTWGVSDKNKHFFSVLQLSGGYQYNLSEKLSFLAEPYFKLPLSGVGYGKVKLNNTGLLFTIGYRPFKSNSEK